jgi:colanic acid biosynthesis glycosyl transferase WcaI
MKINVWGINYAPELTGIGVYNTDLCQFLTEQGEEVAMVTAFPYYPNWKKSIEDKGAIYRLDCLNGVKIYRCWQYVPTQPSSWSRIVHEGSFVFTSFLRQLFLTPPDAYIVISPPLLLGFAAWLLSIMQQVPFVFHLQDLQPDAAIRLGMLKESPLTNVLYGLEKLIYQKAAFVSAISKEMCKSLEKKGVSGSKIVLFPNWVNLLELRPERASWKKGHGIEPGKPMVSYAGNLGVKQGLDVIVETARLLKDVHPVVFVIAGNGAQRKYLEDLARRYALDNVIFEDVLHEDDHTALLQESDICLITQRRGSGDSFLPSKLLKILALSRPVLTNADEGSPLASSVQQGHFGALSGGDPENLARKIVELLDDPALRAEMGTHGREYVLQFERGRVLSGFRDRLKQLVNQ